MSKIKSMEDLKTAMQHASFQLWLNKPNEPQQMFTPADVLEFVGELQNKLVTLAHLIADKTARGEIK